LEFTFVIWNLVDGFMNIEAIFGNFVCIVEVSWISCLSIYNIVILQRHFASYLTGSYISDVQNLKSLLLHFAVAFQRFSYFLLYKLWWMLI